MLLLPIVLLPLLSWPSGLFATELREPQPVQSCELPSSNEALLRLVNKTHSTALASEWEPDDLVELPSEYMIPGRGGLLRAEAAEALTEMLTEASEAGHEIHVLSAFRSYDKQGRIFKAKSRRYGEHRASRVSARAGHSQHQLGTTIDITMPRFRNRLTQRMVKSPEWQWFSTNAHRFGFALSYPQGQEALTGYMYEPWHYRYLGPRAATEMWEEGAYMESYLQGCYVCDPTLQCPRS